MSTEQTNAPAVTMQDLFDRAVTAVILQGRRSVGSAGCAYRSHDGLKCAVGHLITDEVYDAFSRREAGEGVFDHPLEGKLCTEPKVQDALAESLGVRLDLRSLDMLAFLQQAHDDVDHDHDYGNEESVRAWRERFSANCRRVARVYNLAPTAIYTAEAEAAARAAGG